ncbi:Rho GTPase-activating protein 100F [Amphibalanus amphitrite]|uniref:Rho GTPase-activating protein 100F n=1 Tax=Amphibalanus amphitrite TaxID=1232801 RepID=A0A6A4VNM0_AMPAM|nr:Rho GTPase-activating protein 100F [Amphibalanus amphitrite]
MLCCGPEKSVPGAPRSAMPVCDLGRVKANPCVWLFRNGAGKRSKDGADQSADMARSPRRNHNQQHPPRPGDLPDRAAGFDNFAMPQMVVQKDFRKARKRKRKAGTLVSGISTEIFRQIETVENELDAATAAALRLVEQRGEMIVSSLDPRRLSKKAYRIASNFLALQDGRHTIQFVEIVKRPGQTLGLYIREGNGADRSDGVFVSRIALESAVYNSGCLRVGDEVLAVNLVDVTGMGLDDVVIIMSIPRRLVLTTRRQCRQPGRPSPPPAALPSNSTPVVVMKQELPDREAGAPPPPSSVPPPLPPRRPPSVGADALHYGYSRLGRGDGSGAPPRYQEICGPARRTGFDPPQPVVTEQPHGYSAHYQRPFSGALLSGAADHSSGYGTARGGGTAVGLYGSRPRPGYGSLSRAETHQRAMGLERGVTRTYSDQRLPGDWSDSSLPPAMAAPPQSSLQYPSRYQDTMRRLSAMRRRTASLEYASDSEATSGRRMGAPRRMAAPLAAVGERSRSLPRRSEAPPARARYASGYGSAGAADSLTDDSDGAVSAPELRNRRGLPPSMRTPPALSTNDYKQWLSRAPSTGAIYERIRQYRDRDIGGAGGGGAGGTAERGVGGAPGTGPTSSRRGVPLTFSAENIGTGMVESAHYWRGPRLSTLRPVTPSEGGSSSSSSSRLGGPTAATALTHHLHARLEERSATPAPQPEAKSRFSVLNINPAEFLRHSWGRTPSSATEPGLSGLLEVQLLSGRGLRPAGRQPHLRDLYCVLECDHVHKARTVIRTGDLVFDWDETFELDLLSSRQLDFLIYSWDPQFRHKLCYRASLGVAALLREASTHQLALKVEPHGSLYVRLRYTEPKRCFERLPAARPGALFGADLESVVARENSGLAIPLLVKRCVDEVERRGLDIIGLYRLCGSADKTRALRQQLEAGARTADLSPHSVPDINVITGVLKDYLRELPQPLFTKCLYQMLCDALSVCLPDDSAANAKLMLSILDCLPKASRSTLLFLMDHLRLVSSQSQCNKMTPQNVAVCFAPVLMLHSEVGRTEIDFHRPISILKYLLTIWPTKTVREATTARVAPARRSRLTPHSASLERRGPASDDRSEPATTATDSGSESRDSSPNQPPAAPAGQRSRHGSLGGEGGGAPAALTQPFPGPPAAPSYMQTRAERTDSEFTGRSSESDSGYARLDSRSERPGSRQGAAAVHPFRRADGRSDGECASRESSPDSSHLSSADSRRRGDFSRPTESPAVAAGRPGSALGHRRSPLSVNGVDEPPRRKGSAGSAGLEFRLSAASPFREAELRQRSASPRDLEREARLASPFRDGPGRVRLGSADDGRS